MMSAIDTIREPAISAPTTAARNVRARGEAKVAIEPPSMRRVIDLYGDEGSVRALAPPIGCLAGSRGLPGRRPHDWVMTIEPPASKATSTGAPQHHGWGVVPS